MRTSIHILSISVLLLTLSFSSCKDDQVVDDSRDGLDRTEMLENWADNLIIPGYEEYVASLDTLNKTAESFNAQPDPEGIQQLRSAWLRSSVLWQRIAMFEIGKAESIGLRDFTNTYPTNTEDIEGFMTRGSVNLELPSTRSAQGLPALDYLLYGAATNDQAILERFTDEIALRDLLVKYTTRLRTMAKSVLSDWNSGYRQRFIENNGSGGNSSVNKLMNDFMFYFEKSLRAGKVGIPAGVFSASALPDRVEGYYSQEYSKLFLLESLEYVVKFFNGMHLHGDGSGPGVDDYLDFLQSISGSEHLSSEINHQFALAIEKAEMLDDRIAEQVVNRKETVLQLYDELQKCVVLLKVDMFQTMNIKVDFVDADGD